MTPTYRDRYASQLHAAAERTLGPPAPVPNRRPVRRIAILAVLAVGFGATGTAAALTLITDSPDRPTDPAQIAPRVSGKATPLSREDLEQMRQERQSAEPILDAGSYFSVLNAPATGKDELPIRRAEDAGRAQDSRLAYEGADGRVYVRATDREVCIYAFAGAGPSFSSGCAATAQARTSGVFVIEECLKTPPQRRVIRGIAPDAASTVRAYRGGQLQAEAPVQRNGFVLSTDEPIDKLQIGTDTRRLPPVSC